MIVLIWLWNGLRALAWLALDIGIAWAIGIKAYAIGGAGVFILTAWQLSHPTLPLDADSSLPQYHQSAGMILGACVFSLLLAVIWPIVVIAAVWNKLLTIQELSDD